jgi:hypothetical protein
LLHCVSTVSHAQFHHHLTHKDLPRENALALPNPPGPPIRLVVRPLDNRNHIALLEPQVSRLIRVERELGNRLVRLQTRLFLPKDGLRRRRPPGLGSVAVRVVRVESRGAPAGFERVEGFVGVYARRERAVEAAACVGLAVVDVVGPGGRARGPVAVLVFVHAAMRRRACVVAAHALAHGCPAPPLPHDVVVRVVVDGYVVVHAVARDVGGAADAREDTRVEDAHEGFGGGWRRDLAAQELAGGPAAAVELLVGIASLDDAAALETDTGEQTLGLAVAEDAGHTLETGYTGSFGVAANGAGGDGDIAAQGQRAGLSKCADGRGVVEDEDEVGQLEADLAANASADGPDCRGSRPRAVSETGNDDAGAEAARADKAGLEDGEDGEALCVGEDRGRDDLVGAERLAGVDERGEDLARLFAFAWGRVVSQVMSRMGAGQTYCPSKRAAGC